MNKSYQELKTAISNATNKQDLAAACNEMMTFYPTAPVSADPEIVAAVAPKLASFVNARSGAEFPVTLTIKLVLDLLSAVSDEPGSYILAGGYAARLIVADDEFRNSIDPVSKIENLLAGQVGVLYGIEVFTDGYYQPTLRQLPARSLTMMRADGTLGLTVILR